MRRARVRSGGRGRRSFTADDPYARVIANGVPVMSLTVCAPCMDRSHERCLVPESCECARYGHGKVVIIDDPPPRVPASATMKAKILTWYRSRRGLDIR